jgi:DNA-binding response OmpR family regulator
MAKILAVEDNPAILDFYKEFFGDAGFEVATAEDALSAITVFQQFKPDLIILDLDIPAGGGLQVFETLRSRFNSPVPIIFSTGKPEKLPRLNNLHNVAALGKPADPEKLMALAIKMIEGTAPAARPAPAPAPAPLPVPRPVPVPLPAARPEADPMLTHAAPLPAVPGGKIKIMVVDDDPGVLALYSELLGNAGYDVCTAEDAFGGVAVFQQFKPALAVLDVDMPAGGGRKVFERLRIQLASPAPIIFSTGNPEQVADLEKNLNVVVLKKPVSPARLIETIKNLLKGLPA